MNIQQKIKFMQALLIIAFTNNTFASTDLNSYSHTLKENSYISNFTEVSAFDPYDFSIDTIQDGLKVTKYYSISLNTNSNIGKAPGQITNTQNIASITNHFADNSVLSGGAGIHNIGGTIGDITGDFVSNSVTTSSSGENGGAIYNSMGTLGNITGDFINNSVLSGAGAIYNTGSIGDITGNFIGNTGASNSPYYEVGAIYNNGTMTFVAKGQNMEFSNNYALINGGADKVSNAIYSDVGGITNLLAEENFSIIFNDKISGDGWLNIGGERREDTTGDGIPDRDVAYNGTIVLNEDMSGYTGMVSFNGGTIKIGPNMTNDLGVTNFFGNGFYPMGDNLKFDSINGKIDTFDVGSWGRDSVLNTSIEIDVRDQNNLVADSFKNIDRQKINISEIELILENEAPNLKDAVVVVGTGINLENFTTNVETITGTAPIYEYTFNSELQSDGKLVINSVNKPQPPTDPSIPENENSKPPVSSETPATDYNPEVLKGAIGVGSYATNFGTITDRILNKKREQNFESSIWVDTYSSDEKITYDTTFKSEEFDNKVMITTAGFDFKSNYIKGFDEASNLYVGHLTSTQEYDNIEIEQEGFYVGTGLELSKDDRYMIFTILGGKGKVSDKKTSGDKFDLYSFSAAVKLGKEYKLNNNISVEPSLILGYHNITSDGYTDGRGVKISSETTKIFNISPELKVTGNINEFMPYVALAYKYNSYSGGKLTATHGTTKATLPGTEVKNYGEFRIGINKSFMENTIKAYGEFLTTSGDKYSTGVQLGFEYKF